jgi:hypothetical protein
MESIISFTIIMFFCLIISYISITSTIIDIRENNKIDIISFIMAVITCAFWAIFFYLIHK